MISEVSISGVQYFASNLSAVAQATCAPGGKELRLGVQECGVSGCGVSTNPSVYNTSPISALGAKSAHLQFPRADQLLCSSPTSANTTSLNSQPVHATAKSRTKALHTDILWDKIEFRP